MSRQNAPSQWTLQRGKSKHPRRITPQNKLNQSIAQPANAVVKQDRVRHVPEKLPLRSQPQKLLTQPRMPLSQAQVAHFVRTG